ncbi:MAG: phage tail tape measure protein [Candidatus Kapaibacterium sp.]
MAENEIGLKLKIDFEADPRKLNVIINALKNSLGPLGKDIKPIDGDKIAAELNKIQAETAETVTGLNAVDTALKNTGGSNNNLLKTAFTFNQIQQSVVGLTSAMSPFIDEFIELDKNIKNIGTLGRKDFEEFSAISLKLAADIPGTAADMANGIYQAISAGAQGTAEEIGRFVEVAAKAGVAGLSDTTTAVNGLTSVLNAYGRSYEDANEVADTFFAGIKLGKTSFAEMNSALASFVPSASAMEVGFDQATAAIAKLSAMGTPTAQAGTQMNAAFTLLAKGTTPLRDSLKVVGTDLDTLRDKLKVPVKDGGGLVNVFRDIKTAADASGKQLAELTGSVEAAKIIESLAGSNEKYLESLLAYDNVTGEIANNAASAAFDIASTSIQSQADGFQATISGFVSGALSSLDESTVGAIATFNKMAPALSGAGGAVVALKSTFGGLLTNMGGLSGASAGVKNALLKSVIPSLYSTQAASVAASGGVKAMFTALMFGPPPIGAIIAGIVGLGTALYFIVDALHESAEEKLADAEADQAMAQAQTQLAEEQAAGQQKRINAIGTLGSEYERLLKVYKETGEGENQLLAVQNQLIQAYPGAISATNSFEQNLANLRDELEKDKEKLAEYNEEVRNSKLVEAQSNTTVAKAQLDVDVESFTDTLDDGLNDFFNTGYEIRGNNKIIEGLKNDLLNASNDTELLKAKGKILEFVGTSDDLTAEEKNAVIEKTNKVVEQQKVVIEAGQAEIEQVYQNNLDRLNEQFKNQGIEFNVSDDQIKQIAEQGGKSVEEVTAAVRAMEKEARQSKVGELLGQSASIQGDVKQITRLDELIKAFNEAETDAQKAAIGDAIEKIAPDAIKATGAVEDANNNLNTTYKILGENLDDIKKKQSDQYGGELLSKQREFVSVIGEEGEQYKNNRSQLDKLKAEISDKKKLGVDTSEAEAQFKKLSEQNKASIGEVVEATAKLASQGEVSNEVYEELGEKFGLSGEEMKKMVESAKGLTSELEDTITRIDSLGAAFKGALDGAKKAQSDGVSALSELERQRREGEISQIEYETQRADIVARTKTNIKEAKNLTADQLKVEKELGLVKEKAAKKGKDLYTLTKEIYDLEVKGFVIGKDKADLEAETTRIREGRDKTVADEIVAEERVLDLLEKQKLALKEKFKITEGDNGDIVVGLVIKDDQKEKVTQEYDKLLIDINKSDNKKFELEAKITVKEESLVQLRLDLRKQDLEYNLKTAIDDDSKIIALDKLKEFYQGQLTATEEQIKETQNKLDALNGENLTNAQRLEKVELESHLADLSKTRISNEELVNSKIKSVLDIRLAQIEKHYSDQEKLLEKSIDGNQGLQLKLLAINDAAAQNRYDKELESQLSQIDREEELRGISLSLIKDNEEEKTRLADYYNQQRLQKEEEYAAKKQAISNFQQGYELELKNSFEVQKLELKRQKLEEEIELQEALNPGGKELAELQEQLNTLTEDINAKADEFAVAKDILAQGLSDSISTGFAGDTEKMKEGFQATMQVSAGLLKAKAESTILALVLGEGEKLASLGLVGVLLLPIIKGLISGGVNRLLNPVLTQLTSFSTGGRVDSPTLAWVGDASNSRPGADTEWILRDDQIQFLLNQATSSIVNRLVPSLVGMNASLYNAVGKFTNMMMAIGPRMAANNISLYQVTNYFQERMKANTYSTDTVADSETIKQLQKQDFKIRRFATGLGGGAITEPELILAGDTNIPEYVIRQDQLNLIANSVPNNDKLEKKLDEVVQAVKGIRFIIDKETIGQAANKYNNERNVNIKG